MLKTHLKRVVVFAILGAILGGVIYQASPKVYQGTAEFLIATEPTPTTSALNDTEAAGILSQGASESVGTEISILRSRELFREAMRRLPQAKRDPSLLELENLDALYTMYEVSSDRDSRAALVVVKAHDPNLAADLAHEIGVVYNETRRASVDAATQRAMGVLQVESDSVQRALFAKETDLKEYKTNNAIVDLSAKESQLVSYDATLTSQLQSTQQDLQAQEATMTEMRARLPDRPEYQQSSFSTKESPLVDKLENQLSDYETQRLEALRTFTPQSRKVKDLDTDIQATKDKLVDARKDTWRQTAKTMELDPVHKQYADGLLTGQVTVAALRRRISAVEGALGTVETQMKALPQNEQVLAEKTRDVGLLENKYKQLQAAMNDLRFKGDVNLEQAAQLFPSEPEPKPVAPDLLRLLVVCTLGGAIVGFLFSLARESLRATAQTSNELSSLLGLPVSATVPMLQPRQAKAVFRSLPDPTFKPLESFKYMAFAMLYGKDHAPKRVLFTSVGGGVGCSTAAAQYAVAAAKTGVGVVLIDADIRHETVTKMFEVGDKPGLREVINCLMLPSADADVTVETEHATLRLVPAGTNGEDGITDVPVGTISAFLDDLQTRTDLIVIDAPPCDVVSDAMRFAPYVDDIVLVCSARSTKYTNVTPAIDMLKRAGAESVRLVLTGTSPEEEAFSRRSLYVVH
jgi:uncharacterized protein involved in exopolysaccharide biosynthesis/Mrp family chromosome partitioning ATPase